MSPTRKQNNKQNKQNKQKKQRGGGFFDDPLGSLSTAADKAANDAKNFFGFNVTKPSTPPPATEPTTPPPATEPTTPPPATEPTTPPAAGFFDKINIFKSKPAETKPPLIGGKKKQNKTKKARVTKK